MRVNADVTVRVHQPAGTVERGPALLWIHGGGTSDLFYEETVEYGRRLQDAGVPTEVHVAGGAFHAFDMIAPNASVSQHFFASQRRCLRIMITCWGSRRFDPPRFS